MSGTLLTRRSTAVAGEEIIQKRTVQKRVSLDQPLRGPKSGPQLDRRPSLQGSDRRPSLQGPTSSTTNAKSGNQLAKESEEASKSVSTPPSSQREGAPNDSGDSIALKASALSRTYNLDVLEVKDMLCAVESAGLSPPAVPTRKTLNQFLVKGIGASTVPPSVLDDIFQKTCRYNSFELKAFLDWYITHMFSTVAHLRGDNETLSQNALYQAICDKYGVGPMDLEKIKKRFDKCDTDGSGLIDREEFEEMIVAFVGAARSDFSQERLNVFWREIDRDGSGEVDFEEFAEWYLKYFGAGGCSNPTKAFYDTFNPSVQRQQYLATVDDAA